MSPAAKPKRWMCRIGWFIGLWIVGSVGLGVVALALRVLMTLAGMTA